MEIQKLTIQKLTIAGKKYEYPDTTALVGKINELVDVVNELQKNATISKMEKVEPAENVQQISYMAPGDITVFHGFNCSVEFDTPLPYGTRITIKSITKGGNNE